MNGSQEALRQACAIAGLDPDDARLLRLGSNAVYRLKAPIVARISRPGADIDHVRRTVAVARWLESANYPAVRLAIDADQPIVKDGYIVTFWQALSDDGDQYASTPEIAEVLRQAAPARRSGRAAPTAAGPVRQRRPAHRREHLADPRGPRLPHRNPGQAAGCLQQPRVRPPAGRHPRRRQRRQRPARHPRHPGPDRPRRLRHRPQRVGPRPDRHLLRQLRLAHPRGVRGLRARLRLRHHAMARLPGHAVRPRVLDGHLGHPESRRERRSSSRSRASASPPCAPAQAARTGTPY